MFSNHFAKNLFIVLMVAAALASVSFAAFSNKSPATGHSANNSEQIRGSSLGPSYTLDIRAAADRSYDAVEQIRGSNLGPSYTLDIQTTADRSYDAIESLRLQRDGK